MLLLVLLLLLLLLPSRRLFARPVADRVCRGSGRRRGRRSGRRCGVRLAAVNDTTIRMGGGLRNRRTRGGRPALAGAASHDRVGFRVLWRLPPTITESKLNK